MTMYREVLPRSWVRPKFEMDRTHKLNILFHHIRLSFNNSTWLALGATMQACLVMLPIPIRYALAPAILFLLSRIAVTLLITFGILPNHYLQGVIPYRYTALVPDEYGNFPTEDEIPTKQTVAILLLTARVNHPGGWLASPHVGKFIKLFDRMNDDLRDMHQEDTGFFGQSHAFMPTPSGANEIVNISYWRSKEHILKYADSPAHRDAVKWWADMDGFDGKGGKVPHIGISHEIFESSPGQWETVYAGFQPTLLGATSYLRRGNSFEKGTVSEEWISPIIEAKRGKLSSSRGRLGATSKATWQTYQM